MKKKNNLIQLLKIQFNGDKLKMRPVCMSMMKSINLNYMVVFDVFKTHISLYLL